MPELSHRISPPTTQDIAWFVDLDERNKLEFDPPFQRRSVWNQEYKNHFIDTILLGYPAPPIFLFKKLTETGQATYAVVDGKQRLMAIIDFISGRFPVSTKPVFHSLRGKKFSELDGQIRIAFFDYDLLVDYLPTNNEAVVDDIFDRLNRNVARLQPQELRHAKNRGVFISRAEELSLWTWGGEPDEAGEENDESHVEVQPQLPSKFPRISAAARRTMKDVEIVASLLLLLDDGVKSYSTLEMDAAFASRDTSWPSGVNVEDEYRRTIGKLRSMLDLVSTSGNGWPLLGTRLSNQADFYSLFGAIAELERQSLLPDQAICLLRLGFMVQYLAGITPDSDASSVDKDMLLYYSASRSNSNDAAQRKTRIDIVKKVLRDEVRGIRAEQQNGA